MLKFSNKIWTKLNSWSFLSILSVVFVSTPIILIGFNVFNPTNEIMTHIIENLLAIYIKNTLILSLGTGFFTIIIGVLLAYLVSFFEFPGRKFFTWALVLPLAIPDYIGAYVYSNIFSYTGYIPTLLRNKFNIAYNLDIMNNYGAIFVFTICFYPYVYLVVKSFLSRQSSSLVEVSKSLGKNNFEIFFGVILPISRGAIIGGVTLVILEVLNAYGLPYYFGIQTFSTGIFRVWFSFKDLDSAIKMSAMLLIFTYLIIIGEKYFRKNRSYSYSNTKIKYIKREVLTGKFKIFALIFISLIFVISFIVPITQLIYWASLTYSTVLTREFLMLFTNSLTITLITTIIILTISIIIANSVRLGRGKFAFVISKLATMGYSVPGAVIAIGMLLFFITLDNKLVPIYRIFGSENTLVLTMSFALLISAYVVRFLAISFNNVESGFDKIGLKFHEASRTLGNGITKTFWKIDLPMIKPSLIGAGILVFIEIIKELPLTLILRPFNFNTLSTTIKQYVEDEMLPEAAVPSLILIFICFILLFVFNKIEKGKKI